MEVDRAPRETKKPGTTGKLLFAIPYSNPNVVLTGYFEKSDMPNWALEEQEFFAEDLIWLRKVDGTKWYPLDDESITRNDERECAFHHRWFTKLNDWDEETN